MKMEGEESWIDVEIERELASLKDDHDEAKEHDDLSADWRDDDELPAEMDDVDICLNTYQHRQHNLVDSIEHQLNDVEAILCEKHVEAGATRYDEAIVEAARSKGLDVEAFRREILTKLEEEDAEDDVTFAAPQSSDSNGTDGLMITETTQNFADNAELQQVAELSGDAGALVEFCESNELERKFHEQMNHWLMKQKHKENERTIENEQNYERIQERLQTLEKRRQNLLANMDEEKSALEKVSHMRQAEIDIVCAEELEVMKQEKESHSKTLLSLEEERKRQEKYVQDLKSNAEAIENTRKHNAAMKIQSLWRGHQTRLEYGETVQEWVEHGRRKREERRIQEIENERIRIEAEERKRIEEEQKEKRKQEMERLKEEERLRQEEKERLRKIEKDKIEAEKKRKQDEEREKFLEEERKRMIEEERKAKEAIRLEQERKEREEREKRIEEEKRAKEEREKDEAEKKRIEEEKQSRETEQQRLVEEKRKQELKRVEELKKQQEEQERLEEKMRKEAEEKRLKEEQRKAEVERLRKLEEQRQIEEVARIKEEKEALARKRAEDEQRKLEEAALLEEKKFEEMAKEELNRRLGLTETKSGGEPSPSNPVGLGSAEAKVPANEPSEEPSHLEFIQKGRLAWMQHCIPLSKLMMEAKSRKLVASVIPKRRPSSSKKLTILPDGHIFTDGICDRYDEVTSLTLTALPAYNLQPLHSCSQLTMVTIHNCHIMVLDAFEKCPHLRMITCARSKVEVVNLKNLKNLIYLDLSENQISSIHGLDGCSKLRYLNLNKNRITKIDNLCHLTNLHTLILSQNSISKTNNLSEAPTLQVLNLSKNNIRKTTELEKLSLLSDLDLSHNSLDSIPILTNNVLLENLDLAYNGLTDVEALGVFWLPMLSELNLSNNSIGTMPRLESTISLTTLNLSENNFAEVCDFLPNLINCENLRTLSVVGNPVAEVVPNLRDLIKTALPWMACIDGFKIDAKKCHQQDSDFHRLCASQLETKTKLSDSFKKKLDEISKKESELTPEVHEIFYDKSHKMAADFRYAHEYGDLKMDSFDAIFFQFTIQSMSLRSETPSIAPKPASSDLNSLSHSNTTDAKSKFEMALGPKPVKDSKAKVDSVREKKLDPKLPLREKSAIKIQSTWRGHRCRRRLALACDFARGMDAELGSFDEIDVDAWNFDVDALDEEWFPSESPQLVSSTSPVLKPIDTDRPGLPREAWENLSLKPPISPSPTNDVDTQRTKASKSELLSEEWGFKDSKTADLMMRRAKKLKYNAVRKKKLSELDPQHRLLMMRKLEDSAQLPAVQGPRKAGAQRKDYFRAKHELAEQERLEKTAESQNKIHRMYEWLHSAAYGDFQETQRTAATNVSHKPPLRPGWAGSEGSLRQGWAGSEGSLPLHPPGGRRHPSPCSDHLSIHSVESERSGRRFSYEGVASQPRLLPPIKNNSAPSAQRPGPDLGWGGGKKRGGAKRQS